MTLPKAGADNNKKNNHKVIQADNCLLGLCANTIIVPFVLTNVLDRLLEYTSISAHLLNRITSRLG
jgi:hypothetical protein